MQFRNKLAATVNCSIDGIDAARMGSTNGSMIGGPSKIHQEKRPIMGSQEPPIFNRATIVPMISPVDKPCNELQKFHMH